MLLWTEQWDSGKEVNQAQKGHKDKAGTKAVAQHFMETNSTAAYLQFIPVMVLRNKNMYTKRRSKNNNI